MLKSTKGNFIVITTLVVLFSIYNLLIYNQEQSTSPIQLSAKAIQGQDLWQNNNCWSCHQIYGLGGYLGPDLTNVFSAENKGPDYIKAFLNSGIKSMPKFNFTEEEKEALVVYLKEVDSSGYFPNYEADFKPTGWVELKYKNEK